MFTLRYTHGMARPLTLAAAAISSALVGCASHPAPDAALPERTAALMVGDPAPPIGTLTWLKGRGIDGFQEGHVYVIDFWATWCSSCIAEFPDMSAVQREFQDRPVTIVSISRPDTIGCTLDAATQFVASREKDIAFDIGWDESRTTHTAYMKASGSGGIPCAFVVDTQGRIAAIGPGPAELRKILPAVLDGSYDLAGATRAERLDRICQRDAQRFAALSKTDEPAAYAHLARALEGPLWNDPGWLSVVVWEITSPARKQPDLAVADRVSRRALELTPARDNIDVLCSAARLAHLRADDRTAVKLQERALEVNSANRVMIPSLTRDLDEYRKGAPGT